MGWTQFQKVGIVGATGPTGMGLVEALRKLEVRVRVLSRSFQNLQRAFPEDSIEKQVGDALDSSSLLSGLEGCDLVVNCIGLGPEQMHRHPEAASNVVSAAQHAKARILHVSSCWAYLPLASEVLTEDHPRTGGSPWVRWRREAEDVHQRAGGAVAHLPDFFGPHVHTGTVQQAIETAVETGAMNWIGKPDMERESAYVPDAMRIVARLAMQDRAYGERWIVPGCGPLSGRSLAEMIGQLVNRKVKLRAAGPFLLRILSWFKRDLRGFMQMVPEYVKPIRYDASKLEGLLEELPSSDWRQCVGETIRWLQTSRQ